MRTKRLFSAAVLGVMVTSTLAFGAPSAVGAAVPSKPVNVDATGAFGEATVKWAPPSSDGGADVTGYRVSVSNGKFYDVGPDATIQVVTGLQTTGTSYTVSVQARNADGLGPAASVKLSGIKIRTALSQEIVTYDPYDKQKTLYGTAYRADDGSVEAGWTMHLQERVTGVSTWSDVDNEKTNIYGQFKFLVDPSKSTEYRVLYLSGGTNQLGSRSVVRTLQVRPAVGGSFADGTLSFGDTAVFRGVVLPWHRGRSIYLQRKTSDGWRTLFSVGVGAQSRYRIEDPAEDLGIGYYRTYLPAHHDHAAGYSPARKLVVS